MREPQRRDALITRDLILNAAARQLAEGQAVSMRSVAEEAAVARATLYRHFNDVSALEGALVEEAVQAARQAARRRISGATPSGRCRGPLTSHLVGVAEELVSSNERWTAAVRGANQDAIARELAPVVISVIRKAQQQQHVSPAVDPETYALAIVALVTSAVRVVNEFGISPQRSIEPLRRFVAAMHA